MTSEFSIQEVKLCVRFALMEAKMALVEVLKRFSFDVCDKTPEPLPVRNKGLTLSVIGDDLFLRLSRR